MKRNQLIILLTIILFTACKSNQEAYNATYRKFKEKEDAMVDSNAKTTMNVPKGALSTDSTSVYQSERFNLILGNELDLLDYNIVARSFINRTNARGFYNQMVEKDYKSVLVQNEDMMYRIIIASFATKEESEDHLKEIKNTYPEAIIILRIR